MRAQTIVSPEGHSLSTGMGPQEPPFLPRTQGVMHMPMGRPNGCAAVTWGERRSLRHLPVQALAANISPLPPQSHDGGGRSGFRGQSSRLPMSQSGSSFSFKTTFKDMNKTALPVSSIDGRFFLGRNDTRFLLLSVDTKPEAAQSPDWGEEASCVPSELVCVAPSCRGSCQSPGAGRGLGSIGHILGTWERCSQAASLVVPG